MTYGDGFDPVVMDISEQPAVFSIGNPYPNPFNPVVNFEIDISDKSYVNAKIYNITGQEVATVYDGFLSARTHQMRWMAEGHASGIYFIRIAVDDQPATLRKIVLLK